MECKRDGFSGALGGARQTHWERFSEKGKKSPLFKISKKSHKSNKIYQNFWAMWEDEGFKTAPIKKKKIKKKILECILYIEKEQKSSS